jgi:ABC-type dipeptide/oligopeptide/nickel transport system permease subunit
LASVMVEKRKNRDYVAASPADRKGSRVIMIRHILRRTMGPVIVATINLALAIITEATVVSRLHAGHAIAGDS